MLTSSRSSRLLVLGIGALLTAAPVAPAQERRAGADTSRTRQRIEEIDRQIDAPDTAGGLWEEYQQYRDRDREDLEATGERVKVGDSVTVQEDELVRGDVVSIGGDVIVKGVVDGDVVAVGGDVVLHDGAEVRGDAVAVGGRVRDVGDAVVQGEKVSVNVPIPLFGIGRHDLGTPGFLTRFVGWKLGCLAVGLLLALLFNAIAGRRLDVVSRRAEAEPGQSFLIGLLGAFGTPIAMLVAFLLLAITIVGLLLFPVLVILVWLVTLGGFAAVAITVGRRIGQGQEPAGRLGPPRSSYANLTLGYLALHGFLIVGLLLGAVGGWGPLRPLGILLMVLGVFVAVFATIVGYGAALLSRLGTQAPGIVAAPPPAPPAPPPPSFSPPPPPAFPGMAPGADVPRPPGAAGP
jgi:hypothetical protein